MKAMLGEEGTEHFEIATRLNGQLIRRQKIHDPFIHNTLVIGWLDILKCLLRFRNARVEVSVSSTQAMQRAIMTLDPEELHAEEREKQSRSPFPETFGLMVGSTRHA